MSERTRLIISDFFSLSLAWSLYFTIRVKTGWFQTVMEPDFLIPMLVVTGFWMLLFFFFGLYRSWYAKSRIDELALLFKAVTFGVLLLFFAIFVDDHGVGSPLHARLMIALYWLLVVSCTASGRMLLHTFQRRLLESGIGLHNTIIVGWEQKAKQLYDTIQLYPALGYRIVGFVPVSTTTNAQEYRGIPTLGAVEQLPNLIDNHDVKDVLIALDSTEHDRLLYVIAACNAHEVSLKIIPDLYDIISGQARTNQIYGFPLIEIMPQLMQPWERFVKRAMDILVSLVILVVGMPFWILTAIAIKLDSRGPVLYSQERVGKDEKHFQVLKFRSMLQDAEKHSGPVWANKKDPRITRIGKIIRKLRIDEVPQFFNVLAGDMSLVGPRPERPFFVDQLSKEIPLYRRRLKVRPGITGWAQVKHKYDESIDDVRKKVEYDLYYIENMSIRMDFKILLNTVAVVLLGKGH